MHPYVPVDHVWLHHISLLNPGLPYCIARIDMVLVASGWNLPATHYACIVQVATKQNHTLCTPYCVSLGHCCVIAEESFMVQLVGLVDDVSPIDAEHPTILTLLLGTTSSMTFDFETSTSSLEWRRELSGMGMSISNPSIAKVSPWIGAMFLYRHQRQAYLDSSDSKASSVRFSCPLDRIDLVSSDPFRGAMTRISFNISLVHTDDIGKNVDLLGPQILQIGVLKPEPLISLLERSVTAARHRLSMDMSKSPVFLDLGPLLWGEQEVKSTATCSDIKKRGEANISASQDTALLWCSFFCLGLY
jgi:hypothetical protein